MFLFPILTSAEVNYTGSDLDKSCFEKYGTVSINSGQDFKVEAQASDSLFFISDNELLLNKVFSRGESVFLPYDVLSVSGTKNSAHTYEENVQDNNSSTALYFDEYDTTSAKEIILDLRSVQEVNKIDFKDNSLGDIYIEDQRNEGFSTTIVAPNGRIFNGEDRLSFILSLNNGVINQVNLKSRAVHTIQFDSYDLNLDLNHAVKNIRKKKTRPKEMRMEELAAFLKTEKTRTKKYYSVCVDFHK